MNKMGTGMRNDVIIEDKDIDAIIFRNFAGNPDRYHKNGTLPNFWLVFPKDVASALSNKGFNVREKIGRDGDPEYRLQVFVRFDNWPPEVYKVCGRKKLLLDEETIKSLDRAEIEHVDVTLSPYHYKTAEREGVRAYLKVGYFTIANDRLSEKFDFDDEEEFDMPFGE